MISPYVPKEKRKPEAYRPCDHSELANSISDEDVEFEVLRENFSVYDLSNSLVLSLKTILAQVKKTSLIGIWGRTDLYSKHESGY